MTELQHRINRWEDVHTEFKKALVHPDDLAPGIVAFADTDVGQLIIGIDKNHNILGVKDVDRIMRDVDDIAVNNCEPPVTVIQEVLFTDSHTEREKREAEKTLVQKPVIVVNIPKGDMRTYRTNRGIYYIRTSSGRRQASREELLLLFQAIESFYYEDAASPIKYGGHRP